MAKIASQTAAALILVAALSIPASALAAPNNGTKGSTQRKSYCANLLLDCQYATDHYCAAHPEKGSYCVADGYAICNQQDDECLAKAAASGSITTVHPGNLKPAP